MVQLLKNRVLCVGALSAQLNVTQGAVSQHLRILRDADLVVPEKRGLISKVTVPFEVSLDWMLMEPTAPRLLKEFATLLASWSTSG